MLSRICWPFRSIHRSVIQPPDKIMATNRHPPTVVTRTSRTDGRGDIALVPQARQTSFALDPWVLSDPVRDLRIFAKISFVIPIWFLLIFLFVV